MHILLFSLQETLNIFLSHVNEVTAALLLAFICLLLEVVFHYYSNFSL